jgi:hypothetical protein
VEFSVPYCAESIVLSGRSRCVADRGAGFVTLVS